MKDILGKKENNDQNKIKDIINIIDELHDGMKV